MGNAPRLQANSWIPRPSLGMTECGGLDGLTKLTLGPASTTLSPVSVDRTDKTNFATNMSSAPNYSIRHSSGGLDRPARAGRLAALCAAGAAGPADRRLAAAVPLLVVDRPRGAARRLARSLARDPVRHRRAGDAERRLHGQRHRRPRHRCQGRAHRDPAARQRAPHPDAGLRVPRAAARRRPCHPAAIVGDGDLARRRLADPGRGLSLHEAHHLVAAGVPRPHLQLGRLDGLGGGARRGGVAGGAALCRRLLLDA